MNADKPLLLAKYLLLSTAALRPDSTPADLAVLAALLERFNEADGYSRPSLQTLADDTGRDRMTVQRSIRRLVKAGLILVESGSRTIANRYRPCFEVGARMRLQGRRTDAPTGRRKQVLEVGAPVRPEPIPRTHEVLGGGERAAPTGLSAVGAPRGVDRSEWERLVEARSDLDLAAIAEAVELHHARGCPTQALNEALAALRLTRHHRSLAPLYRPAAGRFSRQRKPEVGFDDPVRQAAYLTPLEDV